MTYPMGKKQNTGESLIDNPECKDELVKAFSDAKGGEMERSSLYAAAHTNAMFIPVSYTGD